MLGKTERRLAMVILLTATIPLVVAFMFANSLFDYVSSVWVRPEVEQQLERGVSVYKDYIKAVKDDMKHQSDAIAADGKLRDAAKKKDRAALASELEKVFPKFPTLVSLAIESDDGDVLAARDRGKPVDDTRERKLEVRRTLGEDENEPAAMLVATYAFDRRWEQELERAGTVHELYAQTDKERERIYSGSLRAFGALLGITMIVTVALGFVLARGVTRRINRLAIAINRVAAGDLHAAVPVTGSDEITELARVFNRMLVDMQQSRARIEYLQRIGAWQEMAQRLAHEIKNPLTPIQLAVQECHRKYGGEDTKYRALLDTTLEIVEEEVGTLRRLVGNFSSFARLPQAELREADLRDFVRECEGMLTHLEDPSLGVDSPDADPIDAPNVEVTWKVPTSPLRAAIDRQMLRRVVVNLVRNSVQAIRDWKHSADVRGRVVVSARAEGDGSAIIVEDDGPGVSEEARERIFEPYFTTKVDGTGLGLAIVKKIVVEHGGSIDVDRSEKLGGARFILHLPGPHSLALAAARDRAIVPPSRPSSRALQ